MSHTTNPAAPAPPPPASETKPAEKPAIDPQFRDRFATRVLRYSFGSLIVLTLLAMVVIPNGIKSGRMPSREVFLALVPLLGTWIGTLLAFYFTRESLDAANRNVTALVGKLTTEQQLQQTPVSTVWTPFRSMIKLAIPAGPEGEATPLARLEERFEGGGMSRLPITTPDDRMLYVVHKSTLYAYLVERSRPRKDSGAAPAVAPSPAGADPGVPPPAPVPPPGAATLRDFLEFRLDGRTIRDQVSALAFVRAEANLAEAQARMKEVPGCQDVVLTKTGAQSDPVEGWLTNADIARAVALT